MVVIVQSPLTNRRIKIPVKWLFFEQVARLISSPVPPCPDYQDAEAPCVRIAGLKAGDWLSQPVWIEAMVEGLHPRWSVKRVEFYLDGKPYSYRRQALLLGGQVWWDPHGIGPGKHVLRVAAFDVRGPRTETYNIEEIPFEVAE